MNWPLLIPGLLLGLVSSFHCIGMCGPIALVLPIQKLAPRKKNAGILLYNMGRMFTYITLGVFLGIAGRRVYIAGFQQWFSIGLGAAILCMVAPLLLNKRFPRNRITDKILKYVQYVIAGQMKKQHMGSIFLVGVANGLLPCGMVYFALAGAMSTGTIIDGAAFMAAFGLGTIPLMFLVSSFGTMISIGARNRMKRVIPIFIAAMGVVLILRGMNLDIPYISPYFTRISGEPVVCH